MAVHELGLKKHSFNLNKILLVRCYSHLTNKKTKAPFKLLRLSPMATRKIVNMPAYNSL